MFPAFLVLIGFIAVLAMLYGALSVFAGSMSDDPQAGEAAGREGAVTFVVAFVVLLIVIGVAIWG